jgi:hypothetical protein
MKVDSTSQALALIDELRSEPFIITYTRMEAARSMRARGEPITKIAAATKATLSPVKTLTVIPFFCRASIAGRAVHLSRSSGGAPSSSLPGRVERLAPLAELNVARLRRAASSSSCPER